MAVSSFVPDSGKFTCSIEIEGSEKVTGPVVGWAIVEGAVEPLVLIDGQVFTTVADYVGGKPAAVTFVEIKPEVPRVTGPKLPTRR